MSETQINIPFPDATDLHLRIAVGACRLVIKPGASGAWVTGVYSDPSDALPCRIEQDGGTAKITQEYHFADWPWVYSKQPPQFNLAIGNGKPFVLTLEGGAGESEIDLGGLPILRLLIKQGAGHFMFDFSAPNPQPMSLFDLDAGAAGIEMRNLANANAAEMTVDGGAASYRLEFGGTLARDAHMRLNTGMSSVEILIPATTAAKLRAESMLGSLEVGDGFTKKEGAFWNAAALAGKTPVLSLRTQVALGSLTLRNL